jgi:hypothetical protein
VAEAVALCRPEVICAYPISPQTHIVEGLGELVKSGQLNPCEFINVESEFAAMSVAIGASAAGARSYTATASQGLLFMAEAIYNASGLGLPIVMNYGVMYEFTIDKTSSQYKAPFNAMFNEARVFTYEDTAVVTPNSDTPYSMLWLDLRAEEALGWSDPEWDSKLQASALRRIKPWMWRRNIQAVVAGGGSIQDP